MNKNTEIRVYLVDLDSVDEDTIIDQTTELEEFITEAEKQGSVMSLPFFIQACNDEEIDLSNSFMKMAEVNLDNGERTEIG